MLHERKGYLQLRLKRLAKRTISCLSPCCFNSWDVCRTGGEYVWDNFRRLSDHMSQYSCWSGTHLAVLLIFSLFVITLYKVQYKTGIEVFSFFPIDDSGFENYNEEMLEYVDVSKQAARQPDSGFLFCWVMTAPVHHRTRVKAVNTTWLPNCDAGHFYTTNGHQLSQKIPFHTIFNGLPDSYFKLFWKTRLALLYTYKYVSRDFDWYFKGDDDTYVVVDNLRKYLKNFDPDQPYYIGYRLRRRMPDNGYNAGGSGYALSRAAMKIFAEELFPSRELCPYHEWEDLAIARCLAAKKIHPLDTRDELGRQRFLAWRPEEHFNGDLTRSFIYDKVEHKGFEIYHENLISLHHLRPDEMRLIHGILYGVSHGLTPGAHGSHGNNGSAVETSLGPPNSSITMK
ncbi:unnamed protein product, partial [Mesorhabditis spiculigera]